MEKSPKVKAEIRQRFPGLAHVDGSARHQSVNRDDEPWIHALLTAVGEHTGLAALINTSFNTKGQPLVNRLSECLQMLDELPDLSAVLVEDWLFVKNQPQSGSCEKFMTDYALARARARQVVTSVESN